MAINQESFNAGLYDLLKTRGYDPTPIDSKGQNIPVPQDADVFKFDFKKGTNNGNDKDYGPVWATIDKASNLILYYDDDIADSGTENTSGTQFSDSWPSLLKVLKRWAMRKQLGFELKNRDHLGSDMAQRERVKKKEALGEGYHSMGKKSSYNDSVPEVKIVIQHTRQIQEGEKRYYNVERIFVENINGERFALPTRRPGIAKVYARHVAEGGTPYDERGKHITALVEEYTKMAGFVRATKGKQFNESAQRLVNEGINHYRSLRETLSKMIGQRGYNTYFESWTPTLMETEGDETNINELFVKETLDPRIESAMPILRKLSKNIKEVTEVKELEEWANTLVDEASDLKSIPESSNADADSLRKMIDFVLSKINKRLHGKVTESEDENEEPELRPVILSKNVLQDIKDYLDQFKTNPMRQEDEGKVAQSMMILDKLTDDPRLLAALEVIGVPRKLLMDLVEKAQLLLGVSDSNELHETTEISEGAMSERFTDLYGDEFDPADLDNDEHREFCKKHFGLKPKEFLKTYGMTKDDAETSWIFPNKLNEVNEADNMNNMDDMDFFDDDDDYSPESVKWYMSIIDELFDKSNEYLKPSRKERVKNIVRNQIVHIDDSKFDEQKFEQAYKEALSFYRPGISEGKEGIWQEVVNALSAAFPDLDPTDSLKPVMKKHKMSYQALDDLAREHDYRGIDDFIDELSQQYGRDTQIEESRWTYGCGKDISVFVPKGYGYIEKTRPCGSTAYDGSVNQCEVCARDPKKNPGITPKYGDIEHMDDRDYDNDLEEGLDRNQRRAGQLGPTDPVGKNEKKLRGKLVGNESKEFDEELLREEMSRTGKKWLGAALALYGASGLLNYFASNSTYKHDPQLQQLVQLYAKAEKAHDEKKMEEYKRRIEKQKARLDADKGPVLDKNGNRKEVVPEELQRIKKLSGL